MELGNHQIHVTMQSNYMGEASAPFGSMMALMTEEQDEAEGGRPAHHQGPANFMYYNAPPLQEYVNPASLFQVAFHDHSHMPPEYDLFIPVQGDQHSQLAQEQHERAASITDHEGKCELSSRTIKPELQRDHVSSTRTYSQPSSLTRETRASPTSLDVESSCAKTASETDPIKDKIIAHPNYQRLVIAYMNCRKVGAPPDVVRTLDELSKDYESLQPLRISNANEADPELDQFMDTYCHVLHQYHEELTRPFNEAMAFIQKIELQINTMNKGNLRLYQLADGASVPADEREEEEEEEEEGGSCGEVDYEMDIGTEPRAEDKQLRDQLIRKYKGYIRTLKQEFMKKKKKGKLPKDARQMLLHWWNEHYKWPYPSESEKTSLAESTGLDQKQINNWFINQRKRHWKPSEDMSYMVVNDRHGLSKSMQDHQGFN